MGSGDLFEVMDSCALHRNVDFPGNNHASFYNVMEIEPKVRKLLAERNIDVHFMARAVDVEKNGNSIKAVITADGSVLSGDAFVDCTGTSGPMGNCMEYGNGCSMCICRCPAFGPRVSISAKAGGHDYMYQRNDGAFGAFSGSCKLEKKSLSKALQKTLNKKGVAIVPLPKSLVKKEKLDMKVCRQYALPSFAENIILIDTGYAKMMTPFLPLEELRKVEGFDKARFADPYAGGKGNSIRYLAMTQRDDRMKVEGVDNLFCGGEKAGPYIGHTEAISTGSLAGYNAAKYAEGRELVTLPENTAVGALIKYRGEKLVTFAGDFFFNFMKEKSLYQLDKGTIASRVPEGIYYL